MPSQVNSYGLWLAAQQNPICPVIGPTGTIGPTGPIGPTGSAGLNGISSGLNYYFNLTNNIITNTGPTGGTLNTNTNYAGTNTAYTGGYVGYFVQQSQNGLVSLAKFVSTPLTQSVIPAGPWTFYNNIYSFTGPVGPQPWANPTGSGTPGKVYAIARYQDSITGGQLFKTGFSDVSLSDDTIVLNGNVLSPITLNGTGSFSVEYYAENTTPGNVYEFWTQGNSVAFVNTSLGVANGTQGPTGAPGATGPQGPQGPAGSVPNGTLGQLAYFSSTNTVSGTPNITTNGTNLSVAGPLTVVNQGINTPAILPGSLGSIGGFIPFTSIIGQASLVIAGWRFAWGRTPNVYNGGVCVFTTPFSQAPMVLLSEFGSSNHSYSLVSVGITQFSIFHSDTGQLGFFFLAIGQA